MIGIILGGLLLLVVGLVFFGLLGLLINAMMKEKTTCDEHSCGEDKIKDSTKNDTKCFKDQCDDECCLELAKDPSWDSSSSEVAGLEPLPFDEQTVNPSTDSDIQVKDLGGYLFNDENYLIQCPSTDLTCKSDKNRGKVEISDENIESYVSCDDGSEDASDEDHQYLPRLVYANNKANFHVYCEKIGVCKCKSYTSDEKCEYIKEGGARVQRANKIKCEDKKNEEDCLKRRYCEWTPLS